MMTPTEIRGVLQEFLDLVETDRGSPYENWCALIRTLDRVACAYHDAAEFADADGDCRERTTPFIERYRALREIAANRFPDFGLYNLPCEVTTNITTPDWMLGDAIDDIASIADKLERLQACWEHVSEAHALGDLRREFHFGTFDHIRHLQVYLREYVREQQPHWM